MYSVFRSGRVLPGVMLAGLLFAAHASARDVQVLLGIESVTDVTNVARYRLTKYLQAEGCEASIRFDVEAPDLALAFQLGTPKGSAPALEAVNREGRLPVPVWITRKTAGVRHIRELQGRDLATVAGPDPLGEKLPLAALRNVVAMPAPEQLYKAGDYSSALGLLLHNNTHAAVSELGFVKPLLAGNSLVVSWQGEPVQAAGWYRRNGWSRAAEVCEQALANIQREDDPQVFAIFPEWVSGFALPDSQFLEDAEQ